MAPKPKKLTKKQEQELEEKRKEEARLEKIVEAERKRQEEIRNNKISNKIQGIKNDIIAAKNELESLDNEVKELKYEETNRDKFAKEYFDNFIKYIDWKSYSETEFGYINIRKEKELTGFIHEFKERMEGQLFHNFTFKEKDILEEMTYFELLVKNFHSLINLYYESVSIGDEKMKNYCLKYIKILNEINSEKMNYLTVYFMENFTKIKQNHINPPTKQGISVEKTSNNWIDMCIEWNSTKEKDSNYRIGFFCNNESKQRDASIINFRFVPCKLHYLPKQCSLRTSVIRFVYTKYDEYDLTNNYYFPYISINGLYKLEFLNYPNKVKKHGNWNVKEATTELSKIELNNQKEGFAAQSMMTVVSFLNKKIYIRDIGTTVPLYFAYRNEKEEKWIVDLKNEVKLEIDEDTNRKKAVYAEFTELASFNFVIDKKYLYPYKNWYLRTIIRQEDVLNYVTLKKELKTLYIARLDLISKFFI